MNGRKLSDEQVLAIFSDTRKLTAIAADFGVQESTVRLIKKGMSRSRVTSPQEQQADSVRVVVVHRDEQGRLCERHFLLPPGDWEAGAKKFIREHFRGYRIERQQTLAAGDAGDGHVFWLSAAEAA